MSLEVSSLRQKAVLWPFIRYGSDGRVVVGDPVEIRCRWEDQYVESADPDKGPITRPTTVDVDRLIAVGSKLRLGKLSDLPTNLDLHRVREVTSATAIPDIKGRNVQRTVTLQ